MPLDKPLHDRPFLPEKSVRPSAPLRPRALRPRSPLPSLRPLTPRPKRERKPATPPEVPPSSMKSRGERLIAEFLRDCGLRYYYEYPLIVFDEDGKQRIWYPDFWIPELSIVVEYFGMVDDEQYLALVKKKEVVFKSLKIDFIGLSNHMVQLEKNWEKFIIMKMIEIMDSKDPIYHKLQELKRKYTW